MILPDGSGPKMSEAERVKISLFIEKEFGIKMPAAKKTLLEGRLSKRLAACGIATYGAYFDFVTRDPSGKDEFLQFSDLVSTHETSFFREPAHFDHLARTALPSLLRRPDSRPLEILSAACSTGEEAYTLGMVVARSLEERGQNRSFSVEGVDLSDRAAAIATRGVYLSERTKSIPQDLKRAYLMKSKDTRQNVCRFVPELRNRTYFHTGNLLGDLGLVQRSYDIIFCRNVLIYFDPPNQGKVISTLLSHLRHDGFLYLGHAETVVSLDLAVKTVAHAVYQKA